MPQKDVKCRTCGKVFQADDQLSRAFCLYCGAENHLVPKSAEDVTPFDLSTDPATRLGQLERLAAEGPDANVARDRLLFFPARFECVSRKEERYGDKFIELIATILFYSQNYPGRHAMKRARKDVDRFFGRPALKSAEASAENPRRTMLLEFHDAAEIFLRACRDDKHYGSRLFEIVKLKEDEVAEKAARDVAVNIMHYLVQLGMPAQSDLLLMGLHRAWPIIFTRFPALLDDTIAELPDDDRAAIYRVIAKETKPEEDPE